MNSKIAESTTTHPFKETADKLLQNISGFTQEQFNTIPFEGSWTAGQVSLHLLKSYSGILQTLEGASKKTERARDEKTKPIRDLFLNFGIKMESPEFIVPPPGEYQRDILFEKIERDLLAILAASEKYDLTETCLLFDMPGFGPLTRMEWLAFLDAHTIRHNRQLENIAEKLNDSHRSS